MTRRAVAVAACLAVVVAGSEAVLCLQLMDTERARRRLAAWKQAHACPPPFAEHPPASVFVPRVLPLPARDPALAGDPVAGHYDSLPRELRRG